MRSQEFDLALFRWMFKQFPDLFEAEPVLGQGLAAGLVDGPG